MPVGINITLHPKDLINRIENLRIKLDTMFVVPTRAASLRAQVEKAQLETAVWIATDLIVAHDSIFPRLTGRSAQSIRVKSVSRAGSVTGRLYTIGYYPKGMELTESRTSRSVWVYLGGVQGGKQHLGALLTGVAPGRIKASIKATHPAYSRLRYWLQRRGLGGRAKRYKVTGKGVKEYPATIDQDIWAILCSMERKGIASRFSKLSRQMDAIIAKRGSELARRVSQAYVDWWYRAARR